MDNKSSGFNKILELINSNLTIILLVPTILGGVWQLQNLISIDFNLIRYFSITQLIPDGILILLYISFCTVLLIPILLLTNLISNYIKNFKNEINSISKNNKELQDVLENKIKEDIDINDIIDIQLSNIKELKLKIKFNKLIFKRYMLLVAINMIICLILFILNRLFFTSYKLDDTFLFINFLALIYINIIIYNNLNTLINKRFNFLKYDFSDLFFISMTIVTIIFFF